MLWGYDAWNLLNDALKGLGMGRVFGLEGMGRHTSGPLLRLHRDGWLSWRVAKEAPYPLTAARLFPICTEFPAWMRHLKRFGAQKSSWADSGGTGDMREGSPGEAGRRSGGTQDARVLLVFAGRTISGRRGRQADAWPWPVFGLC